MSNPTIEALGAKLQAHEALGTNEYLIDRLQAQVQQLTQDNKKLRQDYAQLVKIKNDVIVELNGIIDSLMGTGGLKRVQLGIRTIRGADPS